MVYISKSKALKIFESCINELYINSEPSTTWKNIKDTYKNKPDSRFYEKHKISIERYTNIVNNYRKQLNKQYNRQLDWFLLDYAPSFKLDGE